jgi:hypothetical protein
MKIRTEVAPNYEKPARCTCALETRQERSRQVTMLGVEETVHFRVFDPKCPEHAE